MNDEQEYEDPEVALARAEAGYLEPEQKLWRPDEERRDAMIHAEPIAASAGINDDQSNETTAEEIPPPEIKRPVTAFIVMIDEHNNVSIDGNLSQVVEPQRPVMQNDVILVCSRLKMDMERDPLVAAVTQSVVQNMINAQMQLAQQAMKQQEAARIAATLDLKHMRG